MTEKATKIKKAAAETSKYFEAVGRRKTAVARVRLYPTKSGKDNVVVNGSKHGDYFKVDRLRHSAIAPLRLLKIDSAVEARTSGGGITAQAEAVALGISRALIKWEPTYKATLSASGLMTRDSRAVERKKPGLRKARRAHQWKKR